MKWKLTGFSPHRVAWVSAILSLAMVPMHFYVSCEMSFRVSLCGVVLLVITGGLALIDRSRKTAKPLMLAVIGLVAHMMCVH
jgi:hypothetical protein